MLKAKKIEKEKLQNNKIEEKKEEDEEEDNTVVIKRTNSAKEFKMDPGKIIKDNNIDTSFKNHSDKKSFGHIKDWIEDINKYTDNNPIKLIVGNKCDLSNEKQVTEEDKKLLKKQTGIDIIETSAKNSFKITEAMEMITKKLMEKNGQGAPGAPANNPVKAGVSLDEARQQNDQDNNCCSLSF